MKLGFVTNIPNPYNEALFRELRLAGHDVRVLYSRRPEAEGRQWHFTKDRADHIASGIWDGHKSLRSLMRAVDVLIISGSYIDPLAIHALTRRPASSVPVFFWGERLRPGLAKDHLRRILLNRVDGYMTIGRWAEWSYTRASGSPPHIWNLPYTTVADPIEAHAREASEGPIVGYVGSLIDRKGLDIVVRALGQFSPACRPVLEVAGSGPRLRELQLLAEELQVSVRWLGFLQQDDLARCRVRWSAQVVPSRYDGWGVVVNEALAAGVPVIASATTGAAVDLIRAGFNGTVVMSDDEWRSAIADALDNEGVGSCQNAQLVGRAIGADNAAKWLVRMISEAPRRADFVRDAFESVGQSGQWTRIIATTAPEGDIDTAWRVLYCGAAAGELPLELIRPCLDPSIGAATFDESHPSTSECYAMSRLGFEVLGRGWSRGPLPADALRTEGFGVSRVPRERVQTAF